MPPNKDGSRPLYLRSWIAAKYNSWADRTNICWSRSRRRMPELNGSYADYRELTLNELHRRPDVVMINNRIAYKHKEVALWKFEHPEEPERELKARSNQCYPKKMCENSNKLE
ncbi:uncharacterized protein LOC129740265 [Uranotaenia lowii]|uniref:uncharacterized protein LOC129738570 n=1 Tax=Uranotaenia lowii TaxID=190385 RepID=UPI0024795555|nr:uncharacterized protein LOC129738570 [Uranotaenia lowii]XP_055586538.1 uncharacterized protein LOC129739156 [Uranotaenia lowii]XP_055587847.1 uncharacterized protein LOC129740265 [Uranotaenia lowii]